MDHLPYPPNSPYLPIHVPIFVTGLDGGGTIDCTGTPAWTHARLAFETACNARRPTAENILAQLQYWLYFGLISRLSTRPVDISYFRSDDTVALLQSSQVPKILLNYQPTGEATHDILMEAEREFPWCMEVIRNALGNNLNYDAESVLLSIRVLIETSRRVLAQSETSNASSTTADCVSHGGSHHYPWPSCRLLRDRMKNHDVWCPALRYKILTTYSTSAAYYLSSLPRIRVIEASHAMCTDFECTLWQDESQYVQSHCCENKDCGSMIEMPFQQMKDIINGGSIPILSFEDGQIQPHEAVAELPYMALSHVWSGGLGNPRGNAMWPCQLQRLAEMPGLGQRAIKEETPGEHGPESFFPTVTRAVLDPVGTAMSSETKCFWIDTMCLPKYDENGGFPPGNMENGEFWKLRSAAINRMTQTYAAANFTLVLDPELMSTNIMQGEDMDEEGMLHVFARILCSTWMTRCWTYQEAAMSTKLLVQFADGIFPFSIKRGEILKQVELLRQQHPKDWQWRKSLDVLALMEELSAWFSSLPGTRDAYDLEADGRTVISGSNDPARFTNIWNSVASRSTSRTDDRFRIFSLLTNLRPSEVEAVKNRKIRLKAILKSQKYLPLSMLFLPPMSKKEFEGQEEEEAKEREAEITYGITSEPYEEDPWYPLPHKIRNRPLHGTLGSMSYLEEERCLTFSAGDLETSSGTNRVTLFQITDLEPLTRGCRRVTFEVDSDIKFTATVSSARKGGPYLAGLKRTDSIYLLTNLDPISLYHSQVHYEDFIGVIAKLDEIGSTRRSLRLRCAGRLSCNSRMFPTGTPTIALRQESLAHYDSCKVDCGKDPQTHLWPLTNPIRSFQCPSHPRSSYKTESTPHIFCIRCLD